jgi:hypothetical protein
LCRTTAAPKIYATLSIVPMAESCCNFMTVVLSAAHAQLSIVPDAESYCDFMTARTPNSDTKPSLDESGLRWRLQGLQDYRGTPKVHAKVRKEGLFA